MRRRVLVPLAVLFGLLALIAAALTWLLGTEAGLQWAYERARARLPGALSVEALAGRLAGPLTVRGLRYRDGETSVALASASLDWSPAALLAARLRVDTLAVEGLRVTLPAAAKEPAAREAPALPRLPLTFSIGSARLRDLALARAGGSPVEVRTIEIEDAAWGPRTLALARLDVEAERFSVAASGGVALDGESQALALAWRVAPPGFAPVAGRGNVSGTLTKLVIAQELTEPLPGTLRAELRDPLTTLAWSAELSLPELDPHRIRAEWPALAAGLDLAAQGEARRYTARGRARLALAGQELIGRFELKGDAQTLVLDALDLGMTGTPAQAHAQGRWAFDGSAFEAQVRWRALRWPLAGAPVIESPEGEARVAGAPEDYRIEGALRTEGPDLPAARWQLAGRGDRQALSVERLRAELLGGRIEGEGRLAWSPGLAWTASATATGLDPGKRWPDWPGELGATAHAQGSASAFKLVLERLEGTLRGRPVSARGQMVRKGELYPDLRLEARTSGAVARLKGRLTRAWDLRFELSARDLAAAWPDTAGQLEARGRLAGARGAPRVEAELSGQGLAYQALRARTLALQGSLDLSDREPSHATLEARGLVSGDRALERLSVRAQGRIAEHAISAHAATEELAVTLRLAGGYAAGAWAGELRQALVHSPAAGSWTLPAPAPLRVARERLALKQACLRAGRSEACVAIDWDPNAKSRARLSARTVPLALLAPLLPQVVRVKGTVSADADVRLEGLRLTRARAELALSGGSLTLAAGAAEGAVSFRGGTARLTVDERGLRSHAEIRLNGEERLALDLALPKFDGTAPAGPTQPLEGRFVARIADIAPLLPLFPEVERLRGSVRADIVIAGTLADPHLRGEASLREASARLLGPGIQLEAVELTATAERNDVLALRGQARSGKGRIELDGTLALEAERAWRAKLRITGENFQAVSLRAASVVVSPDLRLEIVPRYVAIDGELRVPQARFAPRPRLVRNGVAAVPASRDVVIVNAPEEEVEAAPATPWTVSGQVQVILGERVSFDGFGLTGNIAGQLTVIETPGRVTTGRGEVRIVDGKYEAFGQKLAIERGRLLFAGGPIDNPGIDARAVRKIDEITAGVTVKGTLREPEFVLFSEPAMSQADALSYLLFGHPLESADAAQGKTLAGAAAALRLTGGEFLAQRIGARFGIEEVSIEGGTEHQDAALVLGRQLSPRLYVNYSIGLFEQVNVFRIRYKLSARWALQAESGPYSGADLLYTIER